MAQHVVGSVADIPPGDRKVVTLKGREIVVFNVHGEFFALLNRCPHAGARLCAGTVIGLLESSEPGEYSYSRPGEFLRCPYHGWEFELRSGRSYCEPDLVKVRSFPVAVQSGATMVQGPYVAETFPVSVEEDYVLVEV